MPESFITALDDRCFALEHFIESTGTRNAPSHGRRPPSIRNGYGRSQAAIADGNRLKAAIYTPKVQDVDLPFPTTDGDSQVPKQRYIIIPLPYSVNENTNHGIVHCKASRWLVICRIMCILRVLEHLSIVQIMCTMLQFHVERFL